MGREVDFIVYHSKASEFFWKNKYHPTNKPFKLESTEAMRVSRIFPQSEIVTDIGDSAAQYDPSLFRDKKLFGFVGDADTESGFGNCTVNLIKYSIRAGYDVRWIGRSLTKTVRELGVAAGREVPEGAAVIWHEQPKESWLHSPFKKNVAVIPFETTKVPESWVPRINKFDLLLTLCEQNIQMFKDSGVTIPIELIHWGVDPKKFYPLDRQEDGIFTFGHMGALSYRKGTDLLVEAFQRAFPPRIKDVQLFCKTSYPQYHFMSKDQRIHVELSPWDHDDLMKRFFAKIDCFAFPTRGEGFGLTPLEAMATGVPAIVTNWSGPVEYMKPEIGWTLDYTMVPARDFSEGVYKEECGNWAEPRMDDLVDKLRYAYDHQDEVRQKGVAAAKYVQENFTWDNVMPLFWNALKKHL